MEQLYITNYVLEIKHALANRAADAMNVSRDNWSAMQFVNEAAETVIYDWLEYLDFSNREACLEMVSRIQNATTLGIADMIEAVESQMHFTGTINRI
jgi:hypothetical protein